MRIGPIIVFLLHIAINLWLVTILCRRRMWRPLPWFVSYIGSELVGTSVNLIMWLFYHHLYVPVYWWTVAVQVVLIVGAVRESFVRTFAGFGALSWFPWLIRAVIATVLLYSAYKAIYVPPVRNSRLIALVVGGEFTFQWGIVAVGILSLVLSWVFQLPRNTREMVVLDGCTIFSIASLISVVSRSVFGLRFVSWTQYASEVGFVIAAAIWIKFFSRMSGDYELRTSQLSAEQKSLEFSRYRKAAGRLFRS